jgi:hypothetical protein
VLKETKNSMKQMQQMDILGILTQDKILLETIYDRKTGTLKFAVSKDGGDINVIDTWNESIPNYRPKFTEDIRLGRVSLPRGYREFVNRRTLLAEIQDFIHKYVDIDPGFEEVAARYVMMTWVYDKFHKIPYLKVMGQWGSGKSRFLDVMAAITYHASYLGEAVTPANIYRWINEYPGTLILDEANFGDTSNQSIITQILNNGYKREGGVMRCSQGSADYRPIFYPTFGPKILAAHYSYDDPSLETRFLSTITYQTKRKDIPFSLPNRHDWEEANILKEKLLYFRLKNWGRISLKKIPNCLKNLNPRFIEIFSPLLLITGDDEMSMEFNKFLKDYSSDFLAQMGLSDEGRVAEEIISLFRPGGDLFIKELAKSINQSRNGTGRWSVKKVGKIISALGLKKHRKTAGTTVIVGQEEIDQLKKRFINGFL